MQTDTDFPEYRKFTACVREHALFTEQSRIVAAVSGGADSVCMLLLLSLFLPPDRILAAHLHHGIRGAEADRDASFTASLCERLHIPLRTERVDVPSLAAKRGTGLEETARACRYEFLARCADTPDAVIAVAHTQNDVAETVLMHLMRGSSVDGLAGIAYRRGNVVRPILTLTRTETERVCARFGVTPMTDSTNLGTDNLRARVRNQVLPFLAAQFDADPIAALTRLSDLAAADSAFLRDCASAREQEMTEDAPAGICLHRARFAAQPQAMRRRIVRDVLSRVCGPDGNAVFPEGKDLSFETVQRLERFVLDGTSGRTAEAGRGVCCTLEHGRAVFYHRARETAGRDFEATLCVSFLPCDASDVASLMASLHTPRGASYELFDAAPLRADMAARGDAPTLRPIRAGDRFTPFGAPGAERVRKFLIDRKIPLSERRALRVVALGEEILWIPGVRRSDLYRITDHTREVAIIRTEELV